MSKKSNSPKILSPMISRLQDEIKVNKIKAVSEFWKEIEENRTPIFEDIEGDSKYNLITFVFKEDKEVDNIVCHINLYLQNLFVTEDIKLLERIEDTNIYFKSYKLLKGVRATYNFSKNNLLEPKNPQANLFKYADSIIPDPFNPKKYLFKINGISFPVNEIESPDAPPQPWYGKRANINHGKVEEFTSYSEVLNNERKILAYTPPNYSKNHIPYHFLLAFDGIMSEEITKVSSTLDNLIEDDKIPPVVAIMVENFGSTNGALRSSELSPNPKFLKYIIEELLPWGYENFNITTKPSQSVIAGGSAGGVASTFIAFNHPEIFGNVLSMSGAYWKVGWCTRQFGQSERLPLKFYLDVGVLEEASPSGIFKANRNFHKVLQEKGYPVHYTEFLGGHDLICFRGSIADGLIYLIGKKNAL
ncbi:MAG: alpha/beta hydrolase-fold protein [Promethearchaeota archaeon]|jgi:enterochelin esterase family protein